MVSAVVPAQAGTQWVLGMRERTPCVYIHASKRNGTLYIGVTSDLVKRVWQHKHDLAEGFTQQYGVHMLVWYEMHETMESAISREKAIKEWKRAWKIRRIEETNPTWQDLYDSIC
jgi:putative endonuclease